MRPVDVIVPLSRPAAFDLKTIHLLNSANILEANLISGSTTERGEKEKHTMMMLIVLKDGLVL